MIQGSRLPRSAFHLLKACICLALLAGAPAANAAQPPVPPPLTTLTLLNSWQTSTFYSTNPPGVATNGPITVFRGAMKYGLTGVKAFVLPAAFRPDHKVFLAAQNCNDTEGRLEIDPDGSAISTATISSNASCQTSLDGLSFARTATGFTPLTLINGWTGGANGTSVPAVYQTGGMIYLRGGMASGTTSAPFVLPAGFRPSAKVYLPVNICGTEHGQLVINPNGNVTVRSLAGLAKAKCFTSLDGVKFAVNGTGFQALTLNSGWDVATIFGTAAPAYKVVNGIVYLRGGMQMVSSSASTAFTLPVAAHPTAKVWLAASLCNGATSTTWVLTDGGTYPDEFTGVTQRECLVSLDGLSFKQ